MSKKVDSICCKAVSCRRCFHGLNFPPAAIDIAQPRRIGPKYWSSSKKVVAVMLNPGSGSFRNDEATVKTLRILADYKDGKESLKNVFDAQYKDMPSWGRGRFLGFFRNSLGLDLQSMAFMNLAWCATGDNSYPTDMLRSCFEKHGFELLRTLSPDVVLLCGSDTHSFRSKVARAIPQCKVIPTLHYAHRKGSGREADEAARIRPLIHGVETTSSKSLKTKVTTMNITYAQLCDELKTHLEVDDPDTKDSSRLQSFRNHLSTLNSFLASVGKTLESRVGVELGSGFDATIHHYLDLVAVAPRTKRDRRSHLRLLRRIHEDLSKGRRKDSKPATSLSVELRSAVAMTGLAPKTIAKQASVSPSAMSRWLRGAMPNKRGIPPLRRLETALGLPRNHLVNLVDEKHDGTEDGTTADPYRERLKKNIRDRYLLPESSLTADFLSEWWELFNYKISPAPILERTKKGQWGLIPANTMSPLTPLVQYEELTCPTAAIFLQRFRAFFGAIQTLCGRGTLTLDPTSKTLPVTLAWLAYPKALDAFLKWQTSRSGGLIHNGHKVFCRAVKSLLRPVTGYLWQSPDLAFRLPQACRPSSPEGWKKLCEAGHKLVDGWQGQANCLSRDPVLPIRHLLELDQPLKPLLEAVEWIEKDAAAAPPGSVTEARLRRDALLLAMFISNPLRSRTMGGLTWSPDGTGTLHGNSASGWRLRLQAHHQKNGKGLYDVRLATWVAPRLEAYLEEYRDTILGDKKSPYLFVATRDSIKWIGLGAHLRKITREYIKGSPGFGPHAIRHLVATNWLATHPNDFLTVAELLNDRLDTVMANYAHLKRDLSFHRYEEHIGGLLSK